MLRFPTDYVGIIQKFSATHKGLDLGWKSDPIMPIYAPDDGVVIFEGYYSNKEIACVTHHKQLKMVVLYGHLSRTIINKGDIVKQHQQIGNMGNTGNSNGNHLHYEVWANVPDDFVFTENTIKVNRAKYAIDPLTCTYLFKDQVANATSDKIVLKAPTDIEELKKQIQELTDENVILNNENLKLKDKLVQINNISKI